MRLITFDTPESKSRRLGVRVPGQILDLAVAADAAALPGSMKHLLAAGPEAIERVRALANAQVADIRAVILPAETVAGRCQGKMPCPDLPPTCR